jgi:hypothetical protein
MSFSDFVVGSFIIKSLFICASYDIGTLSGIKELASYMLVPLIYRQVL